MRVTREYPFKALYITENGAAAGLTALGAGLTSSVIAAAEAEEVTAGLNAVLASTGGVAGVTAQAGVFNNAAQVWNHTFFWHSMKPGGGGKPAGRLAELLEKSFGAPNITKDGVTVAKEVELKNPYENMGARMVREARQQRGDGLRGHGQVAVHP